MIHAIVELEYKLINLENNEPIHRREGNFDQADLELKAAKDMRKALILLKAYQEANVIQ